MHQCTIHKVQNYLFVKYFANYLLCLHGIIEIIKYLNPIIHSKENLETILKLNINKQLLSAVCVTTN